MSLTLRVRVYAFCNINILEYYMKGAKRNLSVKCFTAVNSKVFDFTPPKNHGINFIEWIVPCIAKSINTKGFLLTSHVYYCPASGA